MGIFPVNVVKQWGVEINKDFPNRHILLYGEPWVGKNGYPSDGTTQGNISTTELGPGKVGAGVFNSDFRQTLRGTDNNGGSKGGYIFNQKQQGSSDIYWGMMAVAQGARGAIRYVYQDYPEAMSVDFDPMYANEPAEAVNYAGCHDNLTLWARILAWDYTNQDRHASLDYLKQVDKFAYGIILTSQGIPFMQSGAELLKSKLDTQAHDPDYITKNYKYCAKGYNPKTGNFDGTYNSNSYVAPDFVNEINWALKAENNGIFNYYKDMIALRNAHPAFRMPTWQDINNYESVLYPDNGKNSTYGANIPGWMESLNTLQDGVMIADLNGNGSNLKTKDTWSDIIVIYNSGGNYNFNLPIGNNGTDTWDIAVQNGSGYDSNSTTVIKQTGGTLKAEGTSVTVLYQKNS